MRPLGVPPDLAAKGCRHFCWKGKRTPAKKSVVTQRMGRIVLDPYRPAAASKMLSAGGTL
jgi:hypothetical protein